MTTRQDEMDELRSEIDDLRSKLKEQKEYAEALYIQLQRLLDALGKPQESKINEQRGEE
jgi:signal transduction histidine kinase